MKRILTIAFMFLACTAASAQAVPLEGARRQAAIDRILQANDLRTSLQFNFIMTRHSSLLTEDLVSRGKAAFSFPDKVRWEVEQPRPSVFVMNGAAGDRRRQTLLRNVARLSEGGLINETDFDVTVYETPQLCQVDLVPQRRDLGQLFTRITLLTDPATGALRSVVLTETGGDITELEFRAVTRGQALDPELFVEPKK